LYKKDIIHNVCQRAILKNKINKTSYFRPVTVACLSALQPLAQMLRKDYSVDDAMNHRTENRFEVEKRNVKKFKQYTNLRPESEPRQYQRRRLL